MTVFLAYLLIGYFVSVFVFYRVEDEGITGEQVLSLMDYKLRIWFTDHPKVYMTSILLALIAIMFVWPFVLYKLFKNGYFNE
jgi:hypothetical protein